MNIPKLINKVLARGGFELVRTSGPRTRFENFENLASAYEYLLNKERGTIIEPNEKRAKLLARLLGTPPSEAYFIVEALAKCGHLRGDVCEFGVAQGETSALIANEIAASDKKLHLFDSFEGLPKPTDKDQLKDDIFSLGSMDAYTGTMACADDLVRARLSTISFPEHRYVLHKGFIDKVLEAGRDLPKEVCFAYVDFDFYEPIKLALDFLHHVTPPGAVIVVDDYDFFSTGAKTAVDEFIDKHKGASVYELFVPDTRLGYFAVLTKRS